MRFITLISLGLLVACSSGYKSPAALYKTDTDLFPPTLDRFPHCRSYGCKIIDVAKLENHEQLHIKSIFANNETPEHERKNISEAIGLIEQIIGQKIGTDKDVAGTYVQLGHMQHDCIDESTNTTTYLILLNQMQLLKFHKPNILTSRPPILSGRLGPHRTAVIIDTKTKIKYAVDSWFHDNGHNAEIIDLDTWRWGWHP